MTDLSPGVRILSMNLRPQHERLFDEISNKLNELSHKSQSGIEINFESGANKIMLEKMQGQIRRFQNDLQGAQEEMRDKIKNLENVQFQQGDFGAQMLSLSEQLNSERNTNSKLNSDLAKSLEVSLQLQLEIQGLKARTLQSHLEEKKYSHSLLEKLKALQTEVELQTAIKEETDLELEKAKSSFQQLNQSLSQAHQQLADQTEAKNQQIQNLNDEVTAMSETFEELEESARQQTLALKNLMEIAESKIVEIKMALDRKTLESKDYYSHLQQSLTQCSLLKTENANLKDHIEKMNAYLQQLQATQD